MLHVEGIDTAPLRDTLVQRAHAEQIPRGGTSHLATRLLGKGRKPKHRGLDTQTGQRRTIGFQRQLAGPALLHGIRIQLADRQGVGLRNAAARDAPRLPFRAFRIHRAHQPVRQAARQTAHRGTGRKVQPKIPIFGPSQLFIETTDRTQQSGLCHDSGGRDHRLRIDRRLGIPMQDEGLTPHAVAGGKGAATTKAGGKLGSILGEAAMIGEGEPDIGVEPVQFHLRCHLATAPSVVGIEKGNQGRLRRSETHIARGCRPCPGRGQGTHTPVRGRNTAEVVTRPILGAVIDDQDLDLAENAKRGDRTGQPTQGVVGGDHDTEPGLRVHDGPLDLHRATSDGSP
ncbi:MAG: hypothetical protein Q7J52_05590 [Falsiroseomonas sp.]|nr:hypothetical protein [Falsiroseomonas sp.]